MTKLTNLLLRQLLTHLGFQPGDVNAKNLRVFRHPDSGCILFLPENKQQYPPRPADIAGVKAQLAYQGHLDEVTFDRFCEEGKLPVTTNQ